MSLIDSVLDQFGDGDGETYAVGSDTQFQPTSASYYRRELKKAQAENAELRAKLDAWEKQSPVAWKIKFKYDRPENCPEQIITPYDYAQMSELLKSGYVLTPLFTKPKEV